MPTMSFRVPADLAESTAADLLHRPTHVFGSAILEKDLTPAAPQADEALALAHGAADLLVRRYEDQVYRLRHQRQPKLDTALGCRVGAVPPHGVDDAFRL